MSVEVGTGQVWASGDAYERFMGRWSRLVARELLAWLAVPAGARWLDVGSGAGALSATILREASPEAVVGVDPSEGFVEYARSAVPGAEFVVGDAQALPFGAGEFDAVVSGLVLNFVPDAPRAASEMARVTRAGGSVAAYVWDYAEGMRMLRFFWDAATGLDPAAEALDEGRRFSAFERLQSLERMSRDAGLEGVESRPLEVPTIFAHLDDYWQPFLGGQGPAGAYATGLDEDRRSALRERLRSTLPTEEDGSIRLTARALAVRGTASS